MPVTDDKRQESERAAASAQTELAPDDAAARSLSTSHATLLSTLTLLAVLSTPSQKVKQTANALENAGSLLQRLRRLLERVDGEVRATRLKD